MRTWSVMRDFVAFTVTGPFSRAAARNLSNCSRSAEPAKNSSTPTTWHECGMLRDTNDCPQTGHVHILRLSRRAPPKRSPPASSYFVYARAERMRAVVALPLACVRAFE
jgi:hypothetical protein